MRSVANLAEWRPSYLRISISEYGDLQPTPRPDIDICSRAASNIFFPNLYL